MNGHRRRDPDRIRDFVATGRTCRGRSSEARVECYCGMSTPRDKSTGRVRLGVVGVGMIGARHVSAIAAESDAELVAIADPAPAAKAVAAAHGVECYSSAGAMLKATRPDGVVVATPTERHCDDVLAALEAGAHVLVEKPITATMQEANAIVARSRKVAREVLVGHHRRYYPVLHRAAEIVRDGSLGALVAVSGQWTVLKPEIYFAPDWRKTRAAGPVLTNLIHELDSLRFICGEVTHIGAMTANAVRGHDKEETAALVMRFENGALGTFLLSDATPSPWAWEFATGENPLFPAAHQNTHRFTGTLAALEFPRLALWRQDASATGWEHPISRHEVAFGNVDALTAQCRHFCAVVRRREPPRVPAEDAARTLAATLAVFDAAQKGTVVAL